MCSLHDDAQSWAIVEVDASGQAVLADFFVSTCVGDRALTGKRVLCDLDVLRFGGSGGAAKFFIFRCCNEEVRLPVACLSASLVQQLVQDESI